MLYVKFHTTTDYSNQSSNNFLKIVKSLVVMLVEKIVFNQNFTDDLIRLKIGFIVPASEI